MATSDLGFSKQVKLFESAFDKLKRKSDVKFYRFFCLMLSFWSYDSFRWNLDKSLNVVNED